MIRMDAEEEEKKVQKIVESLDHKDPKRITWTEFLDWFSQEGEIRMRIH